MCWQSITHTGVLCVPQHTRTLPWQLVTKLSNGDHHRHACMPHTFQRAPPGWSSCVHACWPGLQSGPCGSWCRHPAHNSTAHMQVLLVRALLVQCGAPHPQHKHGDCLHLPRNHSSALADWLYADKCITTRHVPWVPIHSTLATTKEVMVTKLLWLVKVNDRQCRTLQSPLAEEGAALPLFRRCGRHQRLLAPRHRQLPAAAPCHQWTAA